MTDSLTERYPRALHPERHPPTDAPDWVAAVDNPYLHGLFAPTLREVQTTQVSGEVPADLVGTYVRNGPNPTLAPKGRYHWFDGDGMVHGLRFESGNAHYTSALIQTRGRALEQARGASIWTGVLGRFDFDAPLFPIKDTANTDLVHIDGRLFATWYESGELVELDPHTLQTLGPETFDGQLTTLVSAHSKTDQRTGDFIFFGYGDAPPYMRYGVRRRDGSVHLVDIDLPGPRRPHDIGVTEHYSILHDFPMVYDQDLFHRTGRRIPLFNPTLPTRYGVIPRFGSHVRWFEFSPCYMLHVVNCWEEGDEVVMVGCRTADPSLRPDPSDGKLGAMLAGLKLQANLHEWRMNLRTGQTTERQLDDLNAEFPMIREDCLGHRNRYAYLQRIPLEIPATFDSLVKVDLHTGTHQRYDYGPGKFGSEAPFAPRVGSTAEDDGYVLSFVTDTRTWTSACWIFDAADITRGPVCTVDLPHRVPAGFHATWIPGQL